MALHVLKGSGPPNGITPPSIGMHFVDITNREVYESVGVASPVDWILIGGSGTSFTNFLALLDTPASYSGQNGKLPVVSGSQLVFDNESLVNLKDVDLTGILDVQVIIWDTDTSKFIPDYRIKWRGIWAAGIYKNMEQVNDSGWTMIANKETSERAAPAASGESAFQLPDIPTWTDSQETPMAVQGMRFILGALATIDGWRFWRASADGNEQYSYFIYDITDPASIITLATGNIPQGPVGWVEVFTESNFFFAGQEIDVKFVTQSSNADDTWDFNWTLQDTASGLPATGTYTRSADYTVLRIYKDDSSAIDRTFDLDKMKDGDQLNVFETASSSRFDTFLVQGAVTKSNANTVYEVNVLRVNNGNAVRTGQLSTIDANIESGILPSSYTFIPNFWVTNPPVTPGTTISGYIESNLTDTPTLLPNSYGLDVRGHSWVASDDWDFVTTTLGGGGGGGSSGGVDAFLELVDTPVTYVGEQGNAPIVDGTETSLIFAKVIVDPLTSRGDLLLRDAANANARLQVGTNRQILLADGSDFAWATNLPEMALSTSNLIGCELSINADPTLFDMAAGVGIHVDNTTTPGTPVVTVVNVPERLGVAVTNIATQPSTSISLDISANIVQRRTIATPTQRRDTFEVGVVSHTDLVNIDQTVLAWLPGYNGHANLQDLMRALGFFLTSGSGITGIVSTLTLERAEGMGFSAGINTALNTKDPSTVTISAESPVTFFTIKQDGVILGSGTLLDPTVYDNAGVITTIPNNNNATIQYIYLFASGVMAVLVGQEVFPTFSAAVDASGSETVVVPPGLSTGLLLARIIMKKNATDTTDILEVRISPTIALSSGGAGSSTSMQGSYDVSIAPQIILEAGTGGLDYRDAATPLGTFLFKISNLANSLDFINVSATGIITNGLTVTDLTISRALVTDGVNKLISSITTAAEIAFVNGVTSSIQTQLNAKEPTVNLTINRALISSGAGALAVSPTTAAEIAFVNGVTSAIQTQLDGKEPTIALSINFAVISNGIGGLESSVTTAVEMTYISGVTSSIQTQLNAKEPTVTGTTSADYYRGDKTFQTLDKAAVGLGNVDNTSDADKPISDDTQLALDGKEPTITLTINRAMVTNGSGKVAVSAVTATELGYSDGVTSPIQTQINGKEPTINLTINRALISSAAGKVAVSPITNTELNYLNNVTSNVQTQLNGKEPTLPITTIGDLLVRNSSNVTARLPRGTDTQLLAMDGNNPAWQDQSITILDAVAMGGSMLTGTATLYKNGDIYMVFATACTQAVASVNMDSAVIIPVADRPVLQAAALQYRIDGNGFYRINIRTQGNIRFNQFVITDTGGSAPTVEITGLSITSTFVANAPYVAL